MARPNLGFDHVEKFEIERETKHRLRTILETIAGETSVGDASERLCVSPQRFAELRDTALLGALEALSPRAAGRPPSQAKESLAVVELKRELELARYQVEVERVRSELLLAMPELVLGKAKPPQGKRGDRGGAGRGTST